MIQFNLLPDVKLEFIKARRNKRLVMLSASLVTAVSFTVVILLTTYVYGFQKTHLSNLSEEIERDSDEIKETPDIDKILAIQSQLGALPSLHEQKPVASRITEYISQLTPANASISRLEVNFAEMTMKFEGTANTLGTVNKFVDTLKFTEYKGEEDRKPRAFSDVVLSSFGQEEDHTSYTIDLKFDMTIFAFSSDVSLSVPKITTTRSELEKPKALFQKPPSEEQDNPEQIPGVQ